MCKNCQSRPVYEFTNKRKLCSECFAKYFQKKVLYTIRKFRLIKKNEVVGYVSGTQACTPKNIQKNIFTKGNNFREVVLEDVLKMFAKKAHVELVKIASPQSPDHPPLDSRLQVRDIDRNLLMKTFQDNGLINSRAKRGNLLNKIAVASTIDLEANEIVHEIIKGDAKKLDVKPIEGNVIKPLYLFLDKEVLLYAKIKKLKFKKNPHPTRKSTQNQGRQELREHCSPTLKTKNELSAFINELEIKHPEIKRAVVKGWLKINN